MKRGCRCELSSSPSVVSGEASPPVAMTVVVARLLHHHQILEGVTQRVGRGTDVVARYGGDEFTLILPETAVTEAGVLAERARQCVEAFRSLRVGGHDELAC